MKDFTSSSKQNNCQIIAGGVSAPNGFLAGGVACGLKGSGKLDLALIFSESENNSVSAVFTNSSVLGAPVIYDQEVMSNNRNFRAILINSGCANACTGKDGLEDIKKTVTATEKLLGISDKQVLVASTGIIGKRLELNKIENGLKMLKDSISPEGGPEASQAILTTDSFTKEFAVELNLSSGKVAIGGMAKGAGMIAPQLVPQATMLAFLTTDIRISKDNNFLDKASQNSFQKISVDGDTSTNDSVFLWSNGKSGVKLETKEDTTLFAQALEYVCLELAMMIILDGEGATKLIHYQVRGALNNSEAKLLARNIAESILVKIAFFGEDPNWGRLVTAAGKSGTSVRIGKFDIWYGKVKVVENGQEIEHDSKKLAETLSGREIDVILDLKLGDGKADFYGCDLTYDYVKLNAEYHT